jgi:hypothetical protein
MRPPNESGAFSEHEEPDSDPPFGLVGDYSPGGDTLTRHATRSLSSGEGPLHVYLSGPMTGLPDLNTPAFTAVAAMLRARGIVVFNPAEHEHLTWEGALARDLATILTGGIDALVMLKGWEQSRGARLETYTAAVMGLPIYDSWDGEPVRAENLFAGWALRGHAR